MFFLRPTGWSTRCITVRNMMVTCFCTARNRGEATSPVPWCERPDVAIVVPLKHAEWHEINVLVAYTLQSFVYIALSASINSVLSRTINERSPPSLPATTGSCLETLTGSIVPLSRSTAVCLVSRVPGVVFFRPFPGGQPRRPRKGSGRVGASLSRGAHPRAPAGLRASPGLCLGGVG